MPRPQSKRPLLGSRGTPLIRRIDNAGPSWHRKPFRDAHFVSQTGSENWSGGHRDASHLPGLGAKPWPGPQGDPAQGRARGRRSDALMSPRESSNPMQICRFCSAMVRNRAMKQHPDSWPCGTGFQGSQKTCPSLVTSCNHLGHARLHDPFSIRCRIHPKRKLNQKQYEHQSCVTAKPSGQSLNTIAK